MSWWSWGKGWSGWRGNQWDWSRTEEEESPQRGRQWGRRTEEEEPRARRTEEEEPQGRRTEEEEAPRREQRRRDSDGARGRAQGRGRGRGGPRARGGRASSSSKGKHPVTNMAARGMVTQARAFFGTLPADDGPPDPRRLTASAWNREGRRANSVRTIAVLKARRYPEIPNTSLKEYTQNCIRTPNNMNYSAIVLNKAAWGPLDIFVACWS